MKTNLVVRVLAVLATVQGCTTVNYDSQADQQITSITTEFNQQMLSWESQAGATPPIPATYDAKFYDKLEADITTLRIRLMASQDAASNLIVGDISTLQDDVEKLRQFHIKQKQFAVASFIEAERREINVQFAVLTTFELSLKLLKSPNPKDTSTIAVSRPLRGITVVSNFSP